MPGGFPLQKIKDYAIIWSSQRKGGREMGQTDKQFGGFLRMVITSLRKAIAAPDIETMRALLQELLNDLQNTLED